jgi:hypothetical protein
MNFTMTKIAAALVLTVAATGAQAVSVSTGGVFNMFSQKGLDTAPEALSGPINVDTTISAFVDQSAGTWGVSSTTPFFGLIWTASGGQLITTAGNYALSTATGAITSASGPVANDGTMYFTVGAGQVAGVINFAWGSNSGIRVVDVWNINANGSLSVASAPGMENGPFGGFNAAFELTGPGLVAAVPEASTYGMMLAGLGLVGAMVSRRKTVA